MLSEPGNLLISIGRGRRRETAINPTCFPNGNRQKSYMKKIFGNKVLNFVTKKSCGIKSLK